MSSTTETATDAKAPGTTPEARTATPSDHNQDSDSDPTRNRIPTTLIDAALYYASIGWSVFPVDEDSKVPIVVGGFNAASTEPEQIRAWWTRNPTARIGVALRTSGLIAIDVDPRNGGNDTFAKLETAHGELPRDMHQRSGSGGEHVIMRDPSPGPRGWTRTAASGGRVRGKLGAGVDVKCNGYVVLAPSGSYAWHSFDPANVPDVPPTWIPLLQKSEDEAALSGAGIDAWRESIGALDDVDQAKLREELTALGPRGQGKSTTFSAVRTVFHDYGQSVEDGAPFLIEWSKNSGKPHTGAELLRQVKQIATRGFDQARGWRIGLGRGFADDWATEEPAPDVTDPWEQQLLQALADVQAKLAPTKESGVRRPLGISARDLMARPSAAAKWQVHGLITDGGTTMVGGEPKAAKSWALTEIALAVASGTQAFGEFATGTPKRVFYFYAEDHERDVKAHLRALMAGRDLAEVPENLIIQPRGEFLDVTRDEDLALIIASCRYHGGVDLLCLDPLRDISSAAEDKSDEMSPVMRRLRLLGEILGCTVAVVHHTAKAGGDTSKRRPGQRLRGSSAIHGSVDSGIYLSDLTGDGQQTFMSTITSEVKGARSAGRFSLTLTIRDDANGSSEHAAWKVSREVAGTGSKRTPEEQLKADASKVYSRAAKDAERGIYYPSSKLREVVGVPDGRARAAIACLLEQGRLQTADYHPTTHNRCDGGGKYLIPIPPGGE